MESQFIGILRESPLLINIANTVKPGTIKRSTLRELNYKTVDSLNYQPEKIIQSLNAAVQIVF